MSANLVFSYIQSTQEEAECVDLQVLKNSKDPAKISQSEYKQLSKNQKTTLNLQMHKKLLNHQDTIIFNNDTHLSWTSREPIFIVINYGKGDYPIPGHIVMFERKDIYQYNAYISGYVLNPGQVSKFNATILSGPMLGEFKEFKTSTSTTGIDKT